MGKKKSNGITIANLISVIGFVAFVILTFLGYYMLEKGNLFNAILLCIINSIVVLLLIYFMIHAKTAKNDSKKWFITEMVCLVIYIGFISIWGAKPIFHTASVMLNEDELAKAVENDRKEITKIFTEYETEELKLNSTMYDSRSNLHHLSNIIANDDVAADKLNRLGLGNNKNKNQETFFSNNEIDKAFYNRDSLLRADLLGDSYIQYKTNILNKVNSIEQSVKNMEFTKLIENAEELVSINTEVAEQLSNKSNNQARFEVKRIPGNNKIQVSFLAYKYNESSELILQKLLANEVTSNGKKTSSFSGLGLMFIILSQFLLLITYFCVRRTLAVPIGPDRTNDGGIALFE